MNTKLPPPQLRLDTLPPGLPKLTLGYEVAKWMMRWLIQPNGPNAGKPYRPTDRQMRWLAHWYAVDEDGRWLYQHGARRLSKSSGKSPQTAAMALAELCGPVRILDFDPKAPGGVRGKPHDMPLVVLAGVSEAGALGPMRSLRAFAPKGSRVVNEHNLDPGKTIFYRAPVGELRVITSSAASIEGAEISAAFVDETQLWTPTNGGHELLATLADNAAKTNSRIVETSNAWVPGEQSVAEDTWDSWVAQEEGRFREGAGRILYEARMAAPDTNMADEQSLREALDWIYEGCEWVSVENIMARIWSPKARPDDSTRKYLNRPAVSERAWIDPALWEKMAAPDKKVEKGDEVVLFLDGSKSKDATALIGCRLSDGHIFTVGVWEPDPSDPDDLVDAEDVDRAVALAFQTYTVVAFWADLKEWESWVLAEWPKRYGDDIEKDLWAAPSAKPSQPIAWDMRSHKQQFAQAAEAAHSEIVEGSFTHDGNSALARHVANTRNRPYQTWMSVGKETATSSKKIDAAVAMIGARMLYRVAAQRTKNKPHKPKTGRAW